MTLFRSLESRHRRSLPLLLRSYTMLLTQSVGSSTFWIIPCDTISSCSAFTYGWGLSWVQELLDGCLVEVWCSTPLQSYQFDQIDPDMLQLGLSMELIGVLSDRVTGVFVSWLTGAHFVLWMEQCWVTSLKSWREGKPSIVGPLKVTM